MRKRKVVNKKKFIRSVITMLFIAILGILIMNSAFASNEAVIKEEVEYVVCKGDTLWKIAERYKLENQDPREYIYEVEKLNNMTSATIYEGQTISFQLRLHFLNTVIGNNVTVNPFLRVDFASTIGAKGKANVNFPANFAYDGRLTAWAANAWAESSTSPYERELYDLKIIPSISLSVNTDIINLIFEPGLGYRIEDDGRKGSELVHSIYLNKYILSIFKQMKVLC